MGILTKLLESTGFLKPHIKVKQINACLIITLPASNVFAHHFLWIYTWKTFECGSYTEPISKIEVMTSVPMGACKLRSIWQPMMAILSPWATGCLWAQHNTFFSTVFYQFLKYLYLWAEWWQYTRVIEHHSVWKAFYFIHPTPYPLPP